MARTTKKRQSEKVVAEAQDEITGQACEPAETAIGHCDRVKEGLRPTHHTHHTYLEARKRLVEASKELSLDALLRYVVS